MPQPRPYLIVDNTLPCDLPDLYDCLADTRSSYSRPLLGADFAENAQKLASRALGMAFWVAVGLCVGVMI